MPQPQARDVRFTDSYIEDRSGGLKSPDVGDKRKAWGGACGWGGHNYGVQKLRSGDGRLGDAELLVPQRLSCQRCTSVSQSSRFVGRTLIASNHYGVRSHAPPKKCPLIKTRQDRASST